MGIKLSWSDVNAGLIDGIRIYRSNAFIPADALPSPLATLSATTTEYHDTDMSANTIWHYRVGFYNATEELVTDDQLHGYYPDTGPGPQTLKAGTWELGYFGRCAVAEMFTVAQLRTACGLDAAPATSTSESNLTHWYKFIRKGKIIFVPSYPPLNTVSWKTLYDNGLVYGTDDTGTPPAGTTGISFTTNQRKLISKGIYQFLVRLPKDSEQPTNVLITMNDFDGGEWNELMARVDIRDFVRVATKARWDDSSIGSGISTWSQHFLSADAVVTPGDSTPDNTVTSASPTAVSAGRRWLPFLELQL